MSKTEAAASSWRESRRRSARETILEAAWVVVREQGLAGLSMRDLARRAGVTTPTLYAYFESKYDIYDAMFGQAADEFRSLMAEADDDLAPRAAMADGTKRFARFCTEDVARYQLLFQRTIPGFEPSADSYAHAVAALDTARARLARCGVTDPRHLDLWTALSTGLVDQQISNDPGGDRWTRLIDDVVDMFLAHCRSPQSPDPAATA